MKQVYAAVLLLITHVAFGQTLYEESFETNTNGTNYNTSIPEFSDGGTNFFSRTDGTDISGSYVVTGMDGSFYFAGMDIDDNGATLPVNLSTTVINVSGLSSIDFSVLLAEDDDGSNEDWDEDDYLHITYSVDGGTAQNLLWVENDGSTFNSEPLIDTDFDGTGDGAEITSVFTEFTESISLSGASTIQFFFETNLDSGDEDIAIDNIVVSTAVTGPFISVNPASLSGFQQFVGELSDEQSFNVSATDLTEDLVITVTNGDYEISETSGGTFGNTLTLTESGGTVASTEIFVRLNGTTASSPANGDITLTSAGATDAIVELEGVILDQVPTVFVSTNSLTGFSHFVGTPSAEQTFDVSGEYLTADLEVTVPANYEVSLTSGSGFGTSVSIANTAGSVATTPIYVRLNGTTVAPVQNGDIVVTSSGANSENVSLEGETFDYSLYPIGAVTTNDANGEPDSLDVFVELRGIVHCIDFDGNDGYSFTIIDSENDGISVFNFDDVDDYVVTEGDSIGAKGYIDQFNGLTQIFVEEITVFSQGNATVTPTVVTALDESTESQLITLENVTLVDGEATWPSNGSISITDGTNTFTVRVPTSSTLADEPTPSGSFNITGLGSQFDNNAPYDEGYRIVPCSVEELDLCDLDISTTVNQSTITAVETGADYQWVDCDNGDSPIAGETNQSFTATENGNYAVIISEGDCTDTSECVQITTLNVSSNNVMNSIRLYPNPVANEMHVSAGEEALRSIEVSNTTGQMVYAISLNSFSTIISTSNWEPGIYFVHITTQSGNTTVKVVK